MDHVSHFAAYVSAAATPPAGSEPVTLTVFDSNGNPLTIPKQVAHQADTVAADLAALKVDFNALLAKLQTAGVMASS